MKLYRIKDWDELFENNRTREMKHMNWVPFPTKLDGDGYTELVDRPNGAAIYGCWCACVIIAGRCDPRGTLLRATGIPHDSTSLARISRLDKKSMEQMLEIAQVVGWIDVTDTAPSCGITAPSCPLPNPNPNPNPTNKRKRFVPPTVEEVRAYCEERSNSVDAFKFVNYYTSNGWKVGRNSMKDWKAAVCNWESGNSHKPAATKPREEELHGL